VTGLRTRQEAFPAETFRYGGGTSCAYGMPVIKSLTVSLQVLGQDHVTWFTIKGSTFKKGPSAASPDHGAKRRLRLPMLGHAAEEESALLLRPCLRSPRAQASPASQS
jgi:hypothetical protein